MQIRLWQAAAFVSSPIHLLTAVAIGQMRRLTKYNTATTSVSAWSMVVLPDNVHKLTQQAHVAASRPLHRPVKRHIGTMVCWHV